MKKKSLSLLIALAVTASTIVVPTAVLADTQVPGSEPTVTYQTQVQNKGWMTAAKNGELAGTVQQALRMEAFKLSLTGTSLPADASITYQAQIQNIGWQAPVTSAAGKDITVVDQAGTAHQSLRMEALKITLNNMPGYEVSYQAQVQNKGWMPAVVTANGVSIANAQIAGTVHESLRIEAIKINVQKTAVENAAETAALAAVVKAEGSGLQADIDAAKTAVAAVAVKVENDAFTARINAIKLAVTSVSAVNGKTVQIKFTQPVLKSTVVSSGLLNNITFTAIGSAPAVTSASAAASLSTDGKTLTITPQTTEYFGGDYAVLVPAAVTDVNGNAVTAYSAISTLKDAVRPSVTGVTYPVNGSAHIAFSEPVNAANAGAIESALTVTDETGATVSPTGLVTLASDKASFDVNISAWHADKNYTVTLVGLADFAGNLITPNPTTLTVKNSTVDTTAPTVVSVVPTSLTTMKVTFSEPLKATTGKIAKYAIDGGTAVDIDTTAGTGNATLDSTNTVATITGIAGISAAGLHNITISNFADLSTNAGTTTTKFVSFAADTTAPTYVSSQVLTIGADQYLVVKYSENVTVAGTSALTSATTYVDSNSITHTTSGLSAGSGNATLYDPTGAGVSDSIKIKVTSLLAGNYSAVIAAGLAQDASTNATAAQNVSFALGTVVDTTIPAVTSVTPQGSEDTVVVVFDRDVTAATALNTANYAVEGQNVFKSAIFSGDAHHVTLKLNANAITVSGNRLLTIKNVATAAGKVIAPYSATTAFVENVKPTLVSATFTNATTITATFSEKITVGVGTTDFEFYIDGVKQAPVGNAVVSTAANTVVITVPTITDLTKNYQVKYVGSDVVDTATPANTGVAGTLVSVTH